MKNLKQFGLVALLAAPLAAQAATVTYDLRGDGSAGYTSGSITVTGSDGSTVDAGASNSSDDLTSYILSGPIGLFVCTGSGAPTGHCGAGYGDQPHADGVGANETVTLDFGHRLMRLVSATFYLGASGRSLSGNFDLGVDGNTVDDEMTLSTLVSFLGLDALSHTGSTFSFSADGDNDWFKLTSITVKEVPLPGTLGLLGLGLAALGMRRRQAS